MTNRGEILVYQSNDGNVSLDVRLQDETVWLTQAMMAELFGTTQQNISSHLNNIYAEKELLPEPTHNKYLLVRQEGTRSVHREVDHYNLDAIISVGYRVKNKVGTRFRIWATERLKEYLVKEFTMDDERQRNPPGSAAPVPDYFDELFERIRDIRASERRMYLRVRKIFAMAADDRLALLELLDDRYDKAGTIITGQVPVGAWHELIGEPTIADAIMNRLAHIPRIFELKGASRRRKMPSD